jgi:hypothetical protein
MDLLSTRLPRKNGVVAQVRRVTTAGTYVAEMLTLFTFTITDVNTSVSETNSVNCE